MKSAPRFFLILLLCGLCSLPAFSQDKTAALSATERWASTIGEQYWIQPDITYGVANHYTLKLDVWQRKDEKTAVPTLIYYHGGGWIFGDRTGATLLFLPYLEMGWNVINVEYRMANVSLAPAAVEDCRCALRWAVRNAKQYNIDTDRIVLTGHSAGGHLSLITGMLPEGTGLDNKCDGTEKLRVAAIINRYGISDVSDLVQGPNRKKLRGDVDGKSAPSTHDCKESLAAYLPDRRDSPRAGGRGWARSKPGSGDGAEEGVAEFFPKGTTPSNGCRGENRSGVSPGVFCRVCPIPSQGKFDDDSSG
jgi:acetyl esterase/lipase